VNEQHGPDDGTRKVRDYVSQRMNAEMPPDFVGGVMNEVRQTPQRNRWSGWPLVATLATAAAAVAVVGIGLGLVDGRNGVGSASPSPTPISQPSATPGATVSAEPSESAAPLPSGEFGPVWSMDPAIAFPDAQSCENPFGLPTAEEGENVAWRIWLPGAWYTAESYIGECLWFAPQPWEQDLEDPIPPDEVAIAISLLDGRVTPTSGEFEGGTITAEEPFTVDGLPAIRYEIQGSEGEFLNGDGVVWIIGVEGELPVFVEGGPIQNYMSIFTSASGAGRLAQQVEVLDRMVATLQITDR
jgi:hypothetical protein